MVLEKQVKVAAVKRCPPSILYPILHVVLLVELRENSLVSIIQDIIFLVNSFCSGYFHLLLRNSTYVFPCQERGIIVCLFVYF